MTGLRFLPGGEEVTRLSPVRQSEGQRARGLRWRSATAASVALNTNLGGISLGGTARPRAGGAEAHGWQSALIHVSRSGYWVVPRRAWGWKLGCGWMA